MTKIRLSHQFLEQYYRAVDNFPNLLARATYLTKYKREEDTGWTDTIKRVVEGNCNIDKNCTLEEAEKLFHLMWTGQGLAPGRGLWVGGVQGIPVEARYNCYTMVLRGIEDWKWQCNMLMNGGGVGVSLLEIDKLPKVQENPNATLYIACSKSHSDYEEVKPNTDIPDNELVIYVEDSREGWVEALGTVLDKAFKGISVVINVSGIRSRGSKIVKFGGISAGPSPLVYILRECWNVIRNSAGRKLNSVECLDCTNHIGVGVKSGNVRRSAILILGNHSDRLFRDAKKDYNSVLSHRHSSNNSIALKTLEDVVNFNWESLVEDNLTYGEPGVLNLYKARQTDPLTQCVNPCGEQIMHHREACCLAEVFPSKCDNVYEALTLITRYAIRQRLDPFTDSISEKTRKRNMRIGIGLGGIADFDWTPTILSSYYERVKEASYQYCDKLKVNRPITMTTLKPSGTISLLNGSSPGMHAPFDNYYIRRIRVASNDPMVEALSSTGLIWEKCVYDKTGNTLVFSFPINSESKITVQNQTVHDQIMRQMMVQNSYTDNAVSCTISFNKDEVDDLNRCLKEYGPMIKSISCLPKVHGYEQSPYESISKDIYGEMMKNIDNTNRLTTEQVGDIEIEGCDQGVCPIK